MVKTLTEDFESFVNKISLNKTLVDDIITKHNSLTDMIIDNPPEGYQVLRKRLSGSYGKHTVLNENDDTKKPDVDVILILETDTEDIDKINSDFLTYLQEKKGSVVEEVRQQSNSIGVLYKNINVDIVLAKDNENNIRITSHKSKTWLNSNCLKQVDFMTDQNKKYPFNYRSLMKLFKYLNKECLTTSLKSYTLEMIVHQCVPAPKVGQRLYEVFAETLVNIGKISSVYDIKDCCSDDLSGFDEKDLISFSLFKNEIATLSSKAKDAIAGNRKKWEDIFGDTFPNQPDEKITNKNNYDKKQTPWCNE